METPNEDGMMLKPSKEVLERLEIVHALMREVVITADRPSNFEAVVKIADEALTLWCAKNHSWTPVQTAEVLVLLAGNYSPEADDATIIPF